MRDIVMNLDRDENGSPFLKVGVHDDFAVEMFIAMVYTTIEDLEHYLVNPEDAHPDDLVIYKEQIVAHRKILEWHAPLQVLLPESIGGALGLNGAQETGRCRS